MSAAVIVRCHAIRGARPIIGHREGPLRGREAVLQTRRIVFCTSLASSASGMAFSTIRPSSSVAESGRRLTTARLSAVLSLVAARSKAVATLSSPKTLAESRNYLTLPVGAVTHGRRLSGRQLRLWYWLTAVMTSYPNCETS